jgi:hypothetical protein
MDVFSSASKTVAELEKNHLSQLNAAFAWTDGLRDCITGGVQFGALDRTHRNSLRGFPIVVAIGINYTQGGIESTGELVPYQSSKDKPGTIRGTGSYHAAVAAIAAFHRNRTAWLTAASLGPCKSPRGMFASNAEAADGVTDGFILLMTNLSPFITKLKWQEQIKKTPAACRYILDTWPNRQYLDDLFCGIGTSTALWIGHSSIYGTEWVWPDFLKLMARWNVKNWLLTPNLNGMAVQLHFKGAFAKASNALFPLFRP